MVGFTSTYCTPEAKACWMVTMKFTVIIQMSRNYVITAIWGGAQIKFGFFNNTK